MKIEKAKPMFNDLEWATLLDAVNKHITDLTESESMALVSMKAVRRKIFIMQDPSIGAECDHPFGMSCNLCE